MTAPSAYGQTIEGEARRPTGATYGPYGRPFEAQGAMPPAAYGAGGAGGHGGSPPSEMPEMNLPGHMNHVYQPGRGFQASDVSGMALLPDLAGFEWFKTNWEKAAEFGAERSHLAAQGFSNEQVNQAGQLATQVSQDVGAVSPMNVLGIINKLTNVTQDPSAALNRELLTEYAKTNVVLSSYGHGNELHELESAIRAGEFRGVLTHEDAQGKQEVDIKGMSEFLHAMEAMSAISGGDIGPTKVLQYLRSAGAAGSMTSVQELIRSMALMIASGQSKGGSALQGFEQQFTAGRMSEAAANLLIQMGIINGGGAAKDNPYLRKMGMGQFMMMPGAMPKGYMQEAATDPSIFIMQHLLPKFQEMLTKTYGDEYTKGDDKTKLRFESAMSSQVASRIPGGVEMTEVIRNILLMDRDLKAATAILGDGTKEHPGRDLYQIQMQQNPLMQAKGLGAANENLQIALGTATLEPASNALRGLTDALNGLTIWTNEHSTATKIGLEALAGGLIALGAVGIIALASSFGGLTGVLLGVGAGVTAATAGFEKLNNWLHDTFAKSEANQRLREITGFGVQTTEQMAETKKSFEDHPIQIPWYLPLPAGRGGREEAPTWAQTMLPTVFGKNTPENYPGATSPIPGLERFFPATPSPQVAAAAANPQTAAAPAAPTHPEAQSWGQWIRSYAPSWFNNSDSAAPTAAAPTASIMRTTSAAPTESIMRARPSNEPVPVKLVNPGAVEPMVTQAQAQQMNRPSSGFTGADPTIDNLSSYYGLMPVP